MMAAIESMDTRRRAWRWHFLAAFLVVPFVLWQSLTGTLYLWSEAYVDARHPELRFVAPHGERAMLDMQVAAARAAEPGKRLTGIVLPADPRRSTLVTFEDRGVAAAAFVDPHNGRLLGTLDGARWLPGWTRKLHGGWPLGDPGSWLLELGACWTIVMVLTGLYLWWPRDGRTLVQTLLPRLRAGRRTFWRDLHACVAVWFSALIVLFLLTALPWTSVWGNKVLQPIQRALQQAVPPAAGFAPVFASGEGDGKHASLQTLLEQARARGLDGDLMFYMVDGPPGSSVSVRTLRARAVQERYLLLDRGTGTPVGAADWNDFPLLAKTVATGVDIHEGRFFGSISPWLNTLLAGALVWLSVTGFMAWRQRKPHDALGVPPPVRVPAPPWLRISVIGLCLSMPLLALSAAALWFAEHAWFRLLSLAVRR